MSYQNPRRCPLNVDGPFYTLGDCLACEAPEYEAPDLLAPLHDGNSTTYFVKQPQTPEEVDRACSAIQVCCVADLRYGGADRAIIERLGNKGSACDYVIRDGQLVLSKEAETPVAGRPRMTTRRWLIAMAVIGLVVSGITFGWLRIGWAFSDDPGPFLSGVSVGMSREEVETRAGQPYRRLFVGGRLPPLGVGPARTVAGETWVYVTGPFRVHRFAVEFQGDQVARIIHDKS